MDYGRRYIDLLKEVKKPKRNTKNKIRKWNKQIRNRNWKRNGKIFFKKGSVKNGFSK